MGIDSAYLTEKPESPSFGGDKDNRETTRSYSINNALIPDIESMLPEFGEFDLSDGYFVDYRVSSGVAYSTVSLKYVKDLGGAGSTVQANNLEVKYDLNVNIIDKMLMDNKNYLTHWNYNLYQSFKIESGKKRIVPADYPLTTSPVWWATAKTLADADEVTYKWDTSTPSDFKDKDDEYFWKMILPMTKPGVEAYGIAQAVITERKYFKRKKEAVSFLISGVGLKDPSERFGWPASGTDKKWLAYPIGIQNDGKFFVATNEYHYADKWDTEMYGTL